MTDPSGVADPAWPLPERSFVVAAPAPLAGVHYALAIHSRGIALRAQPLAICQHASGVHASLDIFTCATIGSLVPVERRL